MQTSWTSTHAAPYTVTPEPTARRTRNRGTTDPTAIAPIVAAANSAGYRSFACTLPAGRA
jgi:hypothetical protein